MTTAAADQVSEDAQLAQENLSAVISQLPMNARIALSDYYYSEWQNALYAMSHCVDKDAMLRQQGVAKFLESTSEAFRGLVNPVPANSRGETVAPVRHSRMGKIA